METSGLETKRILLKPVEESDYPILYKWRNEFRFLSLFSAKREVISFENFTKEIKREFERNRHLQFIIERKDKNIPVGTIFSFNFSQVDGYIFINVYIDSEQESRGYGVEAIVLFVHYIFTFLPVHKVCFEIFGYNVLSLSTMQNGKRYGFCEEGRFKEHRFFNGSYHDVFRFAIYRDSLDKIINLLKRFQGHR
ncbi:MAG: GNAT family protein [bacterium]|nr:GNAT family protein [bacterium]